ncbi:DNA polymerase III subunit delta [Pelagibacterales bacterium SAG-MED19]|nr:DNA polymerase III subunit delta [Pelagibacterales bacterium SAG-MED19]
MIVKSYELKKTKIDNIRFFLLHGKNSGLINETIKNDLKVRLSKNIYNYDETEILNNPSQIRETILNKSFFENDKLIIISRATDKISKIIEEIVDLNSPETSIVLISETLEKKSKIRNLFEKNKNTICVAFYEDNNLTLNKIAFDFFKQKKISISQQNINLIVERSSGNRINLTNELKKIENFSINKKIVSTKDLIKLTNLAENYDYTNLVNCSLAKNKKKTMNILNENNLSNEDCIIILRIFLNKLKRLLKIFSNSEINRNIDSTISSFKPPIFWKEKDIVKQQINVLSYQKIQDLLTKTNNIELLVKKNPSISINLVNNFILEQCDEANNSI